ncbi:MAG: hypothetical protein H6Q65_1249 [Firmicutes bacterium]|nr:hypothetical protein [Bacillota bacterium]
MAWQFWFGLSLVLMSVLVYGLQIIIFNNIHDTMFYFMQDLAFIPITVLLVTLLINRMMEIREKRVLLRKMNMLVGVFFSEVGLKLTKKCFAFDQQPNVLKEALLAQMGWSENQFRQAGAEIKKHVFHVDSRQGDLEDLKEFLSCKRQTMVALLANPNLLEHDTFTELMQAVFHLTEELEYRPKLTGLPLADHAHLSVDIARAYRLLGQEWLAYLLHLKKEYPYLFSLALRNNPYNEDGSIIITNSVGEG